MFNITPPKPKSTKIEEEESLFSSTHQDEVRRIKALLTARFKSSAKLRPGEFPSDTIRITPAMAEFILKEYNKGNLPLSKANVNVFAKIISEGRFKTTTQGIAFDGTGRLVDGQHRLAGIVKAGRAVDIRVSFNEHPDAFLVIDGGGGGRRRGPKHSLDHQGYQNTAALAAAARLLIRLDVSSQSGWVKTQSDQISDYVEARPELIEAVTHGSRIGRNFQTSTAGASAAFYKILTQSKYADRLPSFVDRLSSGKNLSGPLLVLFKGLSKKTLTKKTPHSSFACVIEAACIINTWNAVVAGYQRYDIAWKVDDEFPIVR